MLHTLKLQEKIYVMTLIQVQQSKDVKSILFIFVKNIKNTCFK